ncbi:hypothetical protein SAMN04487857_10249 [Pseudomonas sp. ok272]|uniref:cupin domain-containing protein n=1 Tax=unclassified Pseudomonas TaxID=196821 RepID=UPI0008AE47D9|nr:MULTISPECIES: cupin domain-containing protein [unclassified Pseudomonas]SEM44900.1 hypothetical protein SAMN04487857_10249 [Pseudomonas sp. ok272]SFM16723.1 hypothetical protein SAMN04487858_10150 [Pseudomonas sp. ok602]
MTLKKPAFVTDFATQPTKALIHEISDPQIVDAPYQSITWRHFSNEDKHLTAGIWEAGPHKERCSCDYDELCHLLEGRVRLTDSEGNSSTFEAGSTFVVAAGFKGTWENLTEVRKVYAILR